MQPRQTRPIRRQAPAAVADDITIPLTSITYAIKAQNALRARGVRSNITRDERYYSNQSCGYSLSLRPGIDRAWVLAVLQQEHIKVAEGGGA